MKKKQRIKEIFRSMEEIQKLMAEFTVVKMKRELRNCPFCGREVEIKWNWRSKPDNKKTYSIYGHKEWCFLYADKIRYGSREVLILLWNDRNF